MYTSQILRVKWGHDIFKCFIVRNGVKQEGVYSPLLFAIYTYSLLKYYNNQIYDSYWWSFLWSTSIRLHYPGMSSMLRTLSKVCEEYTTELDTIFNENL